MRKIATLTLALAAVMTAGGVLAQQAAPERAHGHHEGRISLDKNNDGVIDRAEAAASPRFAAMFDKLDSNKDGRLEASEHPQRMRHDGKHGMGHAGKGRNGMRGHGMDRIARLDANSDGRISRDEIGRMPGFADKFAQIDGNKDGYLVRSEMQAYHERMRPQRTAERNKRFAEHFATADLNRDGKLSKVEVSEQMPRMAKSFAWLDENHDGFLSREELKPKAR